MSKIYDLQCAWCDKEFQDTVVLSNFFCSEECKQAYWAVPNEERQVKVTSICPKCNKSWSRSVDYVFALMPITGLSLCKECDSGESMTIVGNSHLWK